MLLPSHLNLIDMNAEKTPVVSNKVAIISLHACIKIMNTLATHNYTMPIHVQPYQCVITSHPIGQVSILHDTKR